MVWGKPSGRCGRLSRVSVGLMVFGVLAFSGPALAACGARDVPASPGAAVGVATSGAHGEAGTPSVAPAVTATVGPTVTAAVPAAEAIGTRTAPTIEAAATALAPTAAAASTMDAILAGTPATTTAGQLATAGGSVYAQYCAVCHGEQGQGVIGPALVGPAASFSTFRTAQELLTFDSAMMPLSNPGSLTPQQYVEVVAWILVENGYVSMDAPMSRASFGAISLTR